MRYMLCQTSLWTLLVVCALKEVAAQPHCDGLTQLALNANESSLLNFCSRDDNCTMIGCQITDMQTQMLAMVQDAVLKVLPCALPMPKVEFELLDSGQARFRQQIEMSSNVDIMINVGADILIGTLMTFINHTSDSIGIRMDLLTPGPLGLVPLFAYTLVPLDLSECPTPPVTTGSTTLGTTTMIDESPTSNCMKLSISMWLTLLTLVVIIVHL